MKKITFSHQFSHKDFYMELPKSKNQQGHYVDILRASYEQLSSMLSYHCKVLVIRFDLHLHDETRDNKPVSKLFRKLHKRLRTEFGHIRFGYIWCREKNLAEAQHYHCGLMLDANTNRHPKLVLQLIDKIWQGWNHPKPFTPKCCYYLIERGDINALHTVMIRLSYLAKVGTKGKRHSTTADYGASRLQPRHSLKNRTHTPTINFEPNNPTLH